MKAAELASEVSTKVRMSFSIGLPVRIRRGMLAGFSGTLAGLPSSGRASIRLQKMSISKSISPVWNWRSPNDVNCQQAT